MALTLWSINKDKLYEKWRTKWLSDHPADIGEYSWAYLFTGGKQIRPTLFCELWHYLSPDLPIDYEIAFAIECIHVASLVLDDTPWMDNATERRGRPTLHTVFSPKKAVLIAYDLLDIAISIWTASPYLQSDLQLLKSKLQRLMMGQVYDLEKHTNLIELASLKTGVLFELVTETVAACTGLDRDFWKLWGNNLGILFQWTDDWNDREEDIAQGNINAFNSSGETIQQYSTIWHALCTGIGRDWFSHTFGAWMKQYFTGNFPLSMIHTVAATAAAANSVTLHDKVHAIYLMPPPYTTNIQFSELSQDNRDKYEKYYFSFSNGKDLIRRLWQEIDRIPHYGINTRPQLWNIDESQWESIIEMNATITSSKQQL